MMETAFLVLVFVLPLAGSRWLAHCLAAEHLCDTACDMQCDTRSQRPLALRNPERG